VLARPEAAARTTIQEVIALLQAEARAVALAPELRGGDHGKPAVQAAASAE